MNPSELQKAIDKIAIGVVTKFNPHHGPDGRFTSGGGGGRARLDRSRDSGRGTARGSAGKSSGTLLDLVRKNGGFTYQPSMASSPKDGIAVSPFRDAEAVFPESGFTKEAIKTYLRKHWDRFKDPSVHVGGWHDKEAGKIYLDLSVVVPKKGQMVKLKDSDGGDVSIPKKAYDIARKNGQEAVFDLGTFKTVFTKSEEERRKMSSVKHKGNQKGQKKKKVKVVMGRPVQKPGESRDQAIDRMADELLGSLKATS